MLIDTHCHLSCDDYNNLDEIINEFDGIMIVSGCNHKTNKEVIELVNKYDKIYGTLGIHPEEIDNFKKSDLKFIEDNLNNKKIVGIGEIGLDYYWIKDNKEEQKELFIKQLDIAKKYNKAIVVHSRDSIQDTYDILKKYNLNGSIHCFNSSLEMAREFIKLGYKIGVGGVLTFKNSKKLQEVVKNINLKDILLETDSPYLTPEPYRGQKNKPSNVYYVALKLSQLKETNIEDIINQTGENALKEFNINICTKRI